MHYDFLIRPAKMSTKNALRERLRKNLFIIDKKPPPLLLFLILDIFNLPLQAYANVDNSLSSPCASFLYVPCPL